MNKSSVVLPIALMLLSDAGAAICSGSLKTKHGIAIANCTLYAQLVTGGRIEFATDRSGAFAVDLADGSWSITANPDQIAQWGFAQMDGVAIVVVGGSSVVQNLTLYASEPLWMLSLTFSRPDPQTYKFSVKGQGGTRVTIYASEDMVTWTPYYSRAIATTGFSYSATSSSNANYVSRFFKAVASTD